MSGPVSPPLATTESGTTVRVQPTNTLEFNGADFTVTQSGSKASIAIDSTGTGAALTDTHIGFGSAANLLTGSANFTFTEESGGSGPTVLLTGDKPVLQMRDDTGATLYRTEFVQSGASMFVFHRDSTGTDNELIRLSNNYVFFNDDGEDIDIKMEGQNVDNLFRLDAAQDNIGIGTSPSSGIERLHIQGTGDTEPMVRIEATGDAGGATDRPVLDFFTSAANIAGDNLGAISFTGKDSTGNDEVYARIEADIQDDTAGSEDGRVKFLGRRNAAEFEYMRYEAGSITINELGAQIKFRVEGDTNDSLIRTDAANDLVAIGSVPVTTLTQDPIFQISNQSGPASYRYIIPSTTSPMTLTNNDLQSPLLVHASATALTINLPLDGGVKGQYFQFVSTGGDITIVPSAAAGDTINGGTASLTRSTNNEIYDCVCISSNTWILSNPA